MSKTWATKIGEVVDRAAIQQRVFTLAREVSPLASADGEKSAEVIVGNISLDMFRETHACRRTERQWSLINEGAVPRFRIVFQQYCSL